MSPGELKSLIGEAVGAAGFDSTSCTGTHLAALAAVDELAAELDDLRDENAALANEAKVSRERLAEVEAERNELEQRARNAEESSSWHRAEADRSIGAAKAARAERDRQYEESALREAEQRRKAKNEQDQREWNALLGRTRRG